jgi:hypothetical protein
MPHRTGSAGAPRAWALALVSLWAGVVATPSALQAQVSPHCERNGRRDFCAYTPGADGAPGGLDAGRLVFADHTVYGLQRDDASCRDRGPVRLCKAWILSPPGSDHPIPATYRGIAYEGGYRHTYQSAHLQLTYTFLD